jgi:hypothetical protein
MRTPVHVHRFVSSLITNREATYARRRSMSKPGLS